MGEYLVVPETTLRQWRYHGRGPKYSKVGQLVRYDWADVEAWLTENSKMA